jgi:hypothetical protein
MGLPGGARSSGVWMFGNLVGARSSDRSISSGYGCVSVALVLGILELRQVFIVLLCKISLSGVVGDKYQ